MYKKNDPQSFYEKSYSSLPLQAETLLNKTFPESFCKVVVLHLGDKLLAFSKPSSNQSCVEISLKGAKRALLITLEDVSCLTCIENTRPNLQGKQTLVKKKRNLWLF